MNPLALFAGPYALLAKWGVIALLVAAFGAFAWFKGNAHGTQKLFDYQAKQATERVRIGQARARVTTEVVVKYVKVQGATEVVTKTIEKEVVRYADANPGYCLDADWGRLYDDAVRNGLPGAAGGADGASGAARDPSAARAGPGAEGP